VKTKKSFSSFISNETNRHHFHCRRQYSVMATIFDLPELLLNVMSFVKADPLSFTRCLSVDKRWREIVIENAQQLLADDVYERCQGATVSVGCLNEPFEVILHDCDINYRA
jgi:hypothetical protein